MQEIIVKYFTELTVYELYDVLQLREEVFQIEQNCIYKDIDDKDKVCWHILLYDQGQLMAYTRLVPKDISYDGYASIGRVVSRTAYRKEGYGRHIMKISLEKMEELFPGIPVKISAQAYLIKFYESFGFQTEGEEYLEDNIPHIAMVNMLKVK